ncbi:hypothetical protein C8J57DRAFT_1653419 [Mycena rebaudengoi]|nr:hypothetical protein C8J57DRAFT_1653419 [Mycena rebaudengoi]
MPTFIVTCVQLHPKVTEPIPQRVNMNTNWTMFHNNCCAMTVPRASRSCRIFKLHSEIDVSTPAQVTELIARMTSQPSEFGTELNSNNFRTLIVEQRPTRENDAAQVIFLDLKHQWTPSGPHTARRLETVNNVYEKLQRHRFIQIRGTPASGKTTLLHLLAEHIHEMEPDIPIHMLVGLDADNNSFQTLLEAQTSADEQKQYVLWDECQMTYQSSPIWDIFKFAQQGGGPQLFIIIVCVYGSAGLVALSATLDPNPVGLLLNNAEFEDVLRCAKDVPVFSPQVVQQMWEWSDGYGRDRFRNNLEFTLSDFTDARIANVLYSADRHQPFKRSLPLVMDLQKVEIAAVFRKLLCDGHIPVVADEHGVLQPAANNSQITPNALSICHRNGWIFQQKDRLQTAGIPSDEGFLSYVLPFSFHHSWISSWMPREEQPLPHTSPYELAVDVISRFKTSQLSTPLRRTAATGQERPPEALY